MRKDTATDTAPGATVAALVAVGVRALPSLGIRPSIEIPIDLYRDASSETGTSGSLSLPLGVVAAGDEITLMREVQRVQCV